jgi:hypothetical protein
MHQIAVQGLLIGAAVQEKRKSASLTTNVYWAMLRGSFTNDTMICVDGEAHTLLPQILVVNNDILAEQQHQIMFAILPRNVMLIRRHTASRTSELMTRVLCSKKVWRPFWTRIKSS